MTRTSSCSAFTAFEDRSIYGETIMFGATAEQKLDLEARAKAAGISRSAYIRREIFEKVQPRDLLREKSG